MKLQDLLYSIVSVYIKLKKEGEKKAKRNEKMIIIDRINVGESPLFRRATPKWTNQRKKMHLAE